MYCQDLHAARLADDMRADLLRREEVRFSYVSYAVSTYYAAAALATRLSQTVRRGRLRNTGDALVYPIGRAFRSACATHSLLCLPAG